MKTKKRFSKVFAVLMSVMMVFTMMPGMAFADETSAGGTVKVINAAEDLPAEIPEGSTYELAADIKLASRQQIGTLAGVLDGKGHTITLADKPLANNVSGTIQNLGVKSSTTITMGTYSGSIAAVLSGTIQNTYSLADIKNSSRTDELSGLVGTLAGGKIYNSYFAGNITAGGQYGLVAYATGGEISNCLYTVGYSAVGVNYRTVTQTNVVKKTAAEMTDSAAVSVLNTDIPDTGYKWAMDTANANGGYPVLIVDSGAATVDKTALGAKITSTEALSGNDYTASTWSAVVSALAAAKTAYEKEDSTQTEVDSALSALETAVNALEKKKALVPVEMPDGVTPIEIASVSDLDRIGAGTGKYYVLKQDITITADDWYFPGAEFNGVFDGNGHTITFDRQSFSGLFKYVGPNGVVQNVHFAGNMTGAHGACADEIRGAVVNCYSEVTGDTASGFALRINGGVLSNCYSVSTAGNGAIIKGVRTENGTEYYGTLNNVYWMNGLKNTDILDDGTNLTLTGNTGGCYAAYMQTMDFVNLLNSGRGTYGTKWGQSSSGYPYFGENQEYTPDQTVLPENKAAVVFTPEGGTAADVEDQLVEIDRNTLDETGIAGEFSLKDYDLPEGARVEWGIKEQTPANMAMVGTEGVLSISNDGTLIVTATLVKADSTTELLASVKVTTYVSKIEDIALYLTAADDADGSEAVKIENNQASIEGSADTRIIVKAKYSGEPAYRLIDASAFDIIITADEGVIDRMSGSSIFSFTQPGKTATVTVTNKQDKTITKSFTAVSSYVKAKSIVPGISGTVRIHQRSSNMAPEEFNYIKGGVVVTPSNASYAGEYTITSGNESIGKYNASSGEFIPLKAGTVVFTAEINDSENPVSGTSTVTFEYANPLKSVTAAQSSLTVKAGKTIPAGLVFEGSVEGIEDVSEAGMVWSFSKEGIISISRESGWKQGEGEINTGYFYDADYQIKGLAEGEVTVTGTPVDTTLHAEPVTFTVTVTEGDPEAAADNNKIVKEGIALAQGYLQKSNASAGFNFGEEWLVFILTRSGSTIDPEKIAGYVESVEAAYTNPTDTNLKPTTLARTILTLETIGEDAADVGGTNLVEKLYNSSQIENGGNEAMWALIALDSADFAVADGAKWTRQKLIDEVLGYQSENGGFAWKPKNGNPDVDTTAMALQALAPYNTAEYPAVQTAVTAALKYLQEQMDYECQYTTGSESSAQVLIALSALGKDAVDKENGFVKSVARNLITGLDAYKYKDKGFKHLLSDTEENAYATLQALQGFEAYRRFADGENTLYDLSDVSVKNTLEQRIAEAESLNKANYHESFWSALETALKKAKETVNNAEATEAQLKEADTALAGAIAALHDSNPAPGTAADDISAYVTISVKGELAKAKDGTLLGDAKVTVEDRNCDGKHTVDEVLYAAHEKYYPDGATVGYESGYGSYGLSLIKLWGDTSMAYGYWYNNASCWSLADTVSDNGYITAFVYKDATGWSDAYSKFDKETYSAAIGTDVTLTLSKAGYDADRNTVFNAADGAKIKVIGETADRGETNTDGNITLTFSKAGTYKVMAYDAGGTIVPSVSTVNVTDPSVPTEKVYLRVADPAGKTYLAKTAYDFAQGDTALSILINSGLDVETKYYAVYGSHYVVAIEGLGEFDGGAQSGWMYKVNGTAPNYGASAYALQAGDYVEWLYTRNLGSDIGAGTPEKPGVSTNTGTSGSAGAPGETVTATTTPTEVTVIGSTATATITKENVTETIKQATENKSDEIVVQVTDADTKGAETVKVQLDTTTVKDVVNKTDAVLTVKTENAVVTLDRETLKTVAAEATGITVTLEVIEVAKPTEAQKEAAGENGHVIQLVIKSGNKIISLFNEGKATVTVEIPAKLNGKKVAAIHIGDDGKIEHLKGQEVTVNGKKHYRFDTPHFSTFALVDADEIGLEVEEQMSADEVKALIADLTPAARSVKTPNKNTKVTLKLDAADKAIIEQIEEAGYTVKYNFYRSTKKAAKYKSMIIKDSKTYTNTRGKKGEMYYYKARVQVYDAEGKLIARTALKDCRYANRKWTK